MKKFYLTLWLNLLLALNLQAFANDSLQYNAQQLTENPQLLKKLLKDFRAHTATPELGINNGIIDGDVEQITSIALTDSKIVVAYRRNTTNDIALQAGNISGENITFGGVISVAQGRNNPTLVRLSDSEFAFAYARDPEEGFIRKGTVTGTSISLETSTMFTEGSDDQENIYQLRMVHLTDNRLMVLYSTINLAGDFDIFCRVIDIDDSPASVGEVRDANDGIDLDTEEFDAVALSDTEVMLAYQDQIGGKIARLSVSDFFIDFASNTVIFSSVSFLTNIKLTLLSSNRVAIFYADTAFGNAILANLVNILPTSIGLSPAQTIAVINTKRMAVTTLSDNRIALAYVDANILGGQVQRGYVRILDALSDSFDIGVEVQSSNPDTRDVSIIGLSTTSFVVSYIDEGNGVGNARIGFICPEVATPSNPTVSDVSATGFTLSWDAVPDAIGYRLTVAEDNNFEIIVNNLNDAFILENSEILLNLNPNTQYFFELKAESDCGFSDAITGEQFTLSAPPIALAATGITGSRFRANWQLVEGIDTYTLIVATDITFNDIILTEQGIVDNFFIVEGLTPSTTYYYRVFAVNPAGSSAPSNRITVNTTAATNAPTNLTASPISSTQIQLNWIDNSSLETSYVVERRLGLTGTFAQIVSLPANTTSYNDEGLTISQEYCYRARAEVLLVGSSSNSNTACAQTADVPDTPTNLTAAATSFDLISLSWEYTGDRAQGFRIERAGAFSNGNFIEIASVEAGLRSFEDNQINANTTYTYRVRAFGANGNSLYSNRASATTPIDPSVGIPVPPFELLAISVSPQQIDLVWEYATDPNVIYKIERAAGSSSNFVPLSDFVSLESISTKRFSDTLGLEENQVYYYRIRACTAGGESDYSAIVSAVAVCNLQVVVIRDDSGSEIICGGKTASMTISRRIFGANYQWRRNGQDILGATFANYFASETGQYSCEVSVGFGGVCSAVSINELLVVVLGSPDDLSVDFEGNRLQASVRDADRYEWFLNYELIPNANEDFYEPTQPGIYFVIAVIGNCASTSNLYFFGVTANDTQDFESSFQLAPNPATDRLHFKIGHQINAPIKVSLRNVQGNRIMLSEGIKEDFLFETTLEVANLPRGLYILEVELGKLRGQKKIILH